MGPKEEVDQDMVKELGEEVTTRACSNCVHCKVCILYRGFAQIVANYNMGITDTAHQPPLEAEKLAEICTYYSNIIAFGGEVV